MQKRAGTIVSTRRTFCETPDEYINNTPEWRDALMTGILNNDNDAVNGSSFCLPGNRPRCRAVREEDDGRRAGHSMAPQRRIRARCCSRATKFHELNWPRRASSWNNRLPFAIGFFLVPPRNPLFLLAGWTTATEVLSLSSRDRSRANERSVYNTKTYSAL